MKKFLLGLFIIMLAIMPICSTVSYAEADSGYYVVGDSEVQFLVNKEYSAPEYKFSIPKGFAFTVIDSSNASYIKILYSGIEGLITSTAFKTCTLSATAPARTSPDLILSLSPSTAYTTPDLKNGSDFSGSAMFLGKYEKDGQIAYAFKDSTATVNAGQIYYSWEKFIDNFDSVTALLNPSVIIPDEGGNNNNQNNSTNTEPPKNKTVLRIILILGIVIPAFIIILIIFKSGKKTQKIEREVPDDSDRFDDY